MTAIQLSDKHLGVIRSALEAYVRANLGQFRLMIDELFPFNSVSYEDATEIEREMKARIFPELHGSSFHGIGSDAVPENAGPGDAIDVIVSVDRDTSLIFDGSKNQICSLINSRQL